jgi:hypothetical protein
MVLAPIGTVRPADVRDPQEPAVALNRERGSPVRGFEAQAGEPWVSRHASLGERRPAISRGTPMPRLSPTPARACETTSLRRRQSTLKDGRRDTSVH